MRKQFGMNVNVEKTKVTRIGKNERLVNLFLEGKTADQVNSFRYVGESVVTWNGGSQQ